MNNNVDEFRWAALVKQFTWLPAMVERFKAVDAIRVERVDSHLLNDFPDHKSDCFFYVVYPQEEIVEVRDGERLVCFFNSADHSFLAIAKMEYRYDSWDWTIALPKASVEEAIREAKVVALAQVAQEIDRA